ncbi:hypothetical protein OCH239_15240 [Roseivivax halodurans JCM 10272]|uniref:Uncharacterized protein n=1 Tax=Roseivivax halodurans JCM 10272 TaxID=1449350 RepID=X7EAJ1_9RHOB|nr:hypothetical protein [Roseivivax halodurans]ETX12932.1 hypothetical protein OCH239_15240 [Roseivivax halodurans JCM 10272]
MLDTPPSPPEFTVCIAEDRVSCETGIRLLVASLIRHCGPVPIQLFAPNATDALRHWVSSHETITLHTERLDGDWRKFGVKPFALLELLKRGHNDLLWIDSDIILRRDVRPLFAGIDSKTVVISEEALNAFHADPDGLRARLWELKVHRTFSFGLNSGVLRVTQQHRALLEAWRDLLRDPAYVAAQDKPWDQRPIHLLGDQEVLNALLCSDHFKDCGVLVLRRGEHIIQYFGNHGYTLAERWRNFRNGDPYFVHAMGAKPWWSGGATERRGIGERYKSIYAELSPYALVARDYGTEMDDKAWLRGRTGLSKLLSALGFGRLPLHGLPIALVSDTVRLTKAIIQGDSDTLLRMRYGVPRK